MYIKCPRVTFQGPRATKEKESASQTRDANLATLLPKFETLLRSFLVLRTQTGLCTSAPTKKTTKAYHPNNARSIALVLAFILLAYCVSADSVLADVPGRFRLIEGNRGFCLPDIEIQANEDAVSTDGIRVRGSQFRADGKQVCTGELEFRKSTPEDPNDFRHTGYFVAGSSVGTGSDFRCNESTVSKVDITKPRLPFTAQYYVNNLSPFSVPFESKHTYVYMEYIGLERACIYERVEKRNLGSPEWTKKFKLSLSAMIVVTTVFFIAGFTVPWLVARFIQTHQD